MGQLDPSTYVKDLHKTTLSCRGHSSRTMVLGNHDWHRANAVFAGAFPGARVDWVSYWCSAVPILQRHRHLLGHYKLVIYGVSGRHQHRCSGQNVHRV